MVGKALKVGLRPIVAINKIGPSDGRHEEVINEVFDLFAALDATDEQLDFPFLYGSGRDGWMNVNPEGPKEQGLEPLLDLVLKHVPAPNVGEGAFRNDRHAARSQPLPRPHHHGPYRCRLDQAEPGCQGALLGWQDGETGRISKILAFRGIERHPIEEAHAGDIVAIAGLSKGTVADTFCDPSVTERCMPQPIDPPTVTMSFIVQTIARWPAPKATRSLRRVIRDRLFKEAKARCAEDRRSRGKDSFYVSGRGELQLAVLIENMRREGFELAVSRPRVVMHNDENGTLLEPIEEVVVDVDEEYAGVVCPEDVRTQGRNDGTASFGRQPSALVFLAPTRG